VLLATHHLNIAFLEKEKLFDKFMWLNFYTATDVTSTAGALMVKNLIEGNHFGGQLLVKISREETENPKPMGVSQILFDKTEEKDDQKSKLFASLNEVKKKEGKSLSNYEKRPKSVKKDVEFYYEI